ncbi:hypothetical protein BASA60_011233 [Batrachochytrium salamandrivorans]|nr:hypothetical protein BASA60_011233 [Batrachochytrium salamandrivorans]
MDQEIAVMLRHYGRDIIMMTNRTSLDTDTKAIRYLRIAHVFVYKTSTTSYGRVVEENFGKPWYVAHNPQSVRWHLGPILTAPVLTNRLLLRLGPVETETCEHQV